MDSFEFNKLAGGLLGALLVTMGIGIVSDALFYRAPPAKAGYPLPVATAVKTAAATKQKAPLATLLAKASAKRGETDAKVCEACHNFAKGAGPKVGPPLYDVVGRKVASFPGFDYSDALKKKGGDWTFADLFQWIKDPQAYAPGTKMGFAGEPNRQKRADILAYLRTLSGHPVPFPKPPAAAPAGKSASAGKTAAAGAAPAAKTATAAAPAATRYASLLAAANPKHGKDDARVCEACHNFAKGAGPKVGPPLYDVVGRKVASYPGFDYSSALKKKGGKWTFVRLFKWIKNPQADAPGTKMTFAGEPNVKKRADIIAYLRTLSGHPVPLPSAGPAGGAPAGKSPPAANTPPAPASKG